jgi:YHS domain-containing protein
MKRMFLMMAIMLIAVITLKAQSPEIFIKNGYAIGGFDAVAYFTENKPVKGDTTISITWKKAKWLFSSKKNADLFQSNPEKYAPQYGGYCAYGCSRGYKATTEPDAFTVSDGKLYLNYNLKTKEVWLKDMKAYIQKADKNCESIQNN